MESLYVMHDSQLLGPYSLEEIRALIRKGILSAGDLAQKSETAPWQPLSSFLPPARRRIPLGKIFLGLMVLAALGFIVLTACLVYAPTDEWVGISRSEFGQRAIAEGHLPANATRALFYDTGFTDSARWVAYSADKETLDRQFQNLARESGKVIDWPPTEPHRSAVARARHNPVPPPPRAGWRNWGYWKVGPNSQGKFCELNSETESTTVYYDTESSRIYYMILSR